MRHAPALLSALFLLLVAPTPPVSAHAVGVLDHYGCHSDRRLRNYHCHRKQFANHIFESKAAMLRQKSHQAESPETVAPADAPVQTREKSMTSRWRPSWLRQSDMTAPNDIEQRLRLLMDLHKKGLVSDQEYENKRREILGDL